jgi:rhamnopyranosyl-N-acetylglucosaminyl-diphospho-decaprenol beta-1,3/1,4-galactofuranosyltransferase
MKNIQILAVVVTHNRQVLLSRCLDNLLAQKRQPDHILVVNNASDDGTVEMLQKREINFITQENLGSAGGWHSGIKYALDHGFDAIWLMDDDGFPDVDALRLLENALSSDVVCASSVVVREDLPTDFVFPLPLLNSSNLPIIWGRKRKLVSINELRSFAPEGTYPFAHFFNGALISIDAVRKVGNVDRNFFMSGDELDYQHRLRKAGKVISVVDAIHYHPDQSKRPYTPAKVYYFLKNSLVLNTRYFDAVWIRHALTVAVVIARTASRNSIRAAISLLLGANAPMFYLAIIRGLRGKLGKDIDE